MTVRQALLDIVLALVLFLFAGLLVASWTTSLPVGWRMPVTIVVQGVLLIGVVRLILLWRGESWSQIRVLVPRPVDLPRGALAFGVCLGLNLVLIYALQAAMPDVVESHTERLGLIAGFLSENLSLTGLVIMLLFVGVYEEIFARGFLLSRCQTLLGGFWVPVVVSSLLFGLGHLYQGWIGVAQTTLVGLVLAVSTLRWGTIWPAVFAHAMLDIASILIMDAAFEAGA